MGNNTLRRGRRIALVGAELEGGWINRPDKAKGQLHGDSSVQVMEELTSAANAAGVSMPYPYIGEFVSFPMRPSLLPQWVEANYPDAVNSTCGLHIHVSTRSNYHYSRLMDNAKIERVDGHRWAKQKMEDSGFAQYLLSNIYRWAKRSKLPSDCPLWDRIAGGNRFCRRHIAPDVQARARSKHDSRYAVVNFCYTLRKTMEIRVLGGLPTAEHARSAVAFTLRTVERYLRELPDEDPNPIEVITLADPPLVQVTRDEWAPWESEVSNTTLPPARFDPMSLTRQWAIDMHSIYPEDCDRWSINRWDSERAPENYFGHDARDCSACRAGMTELANFLIACGIDITQ